MSKAGEKVQPFIEGRKVYLRALSSKDIPLWYDWFNNHEVTTHMNKGIFPNTQEAQQEFFNSISNSKADLQLGIVSIESGKLVGLVGLHKIDWIHRKADISVMIGHPEAWGKNIGKEAVSLTVSHAFNKMNLHKLTAGMWSSNLASKKIFEKNGFVREGTLKEQFWDGKIYVDELRYGLLRTEWEQLKKD